MTSMIGNGLRATATSRTIVASRQKLRTLEGVRALAAVLVVFFHSQMISARFLHYEPFDGKLVGGRRGVDLFFVLSGFIITFVHINDFGKRSMLLDFLFRRASRVYPSLWTLTLLSIPLFAIGFGQAGAAGALSPQSIAASFLLLPQSTTPLLAVSWTLKYEMFFYMLVSACFISIRFGTALFLIWQIAIGCFLLTGTAHLPYAVAYYGQPICLEFGIGVVCAVCIKNEYFGNTSSSLIWVGFWTGASIFFIAALNDSIDLPAEGYSSLPFGLSSGIVILSLCVLERREQIRASNTLVFIGSASYALYLIHWPAIRIAASIFSHYGIVRGELAAYIFVAVGMVAGLVFYRLFDRPAQKYILTWYRNKTRSSSNQRDTAAGVSLLER